jgi:hypothetical protein
MEKSNLSDEGKSRCERQHILEHFSNARAMSNCLQGVFFLWKKTLDILLPLYPNWRNARAAKTKARRGWNAW